MDREWAGQALFADGTENFVSPMEPNPGDTVTIRFRTGHDCADAVYYVSGAHKKAMSLEYSEGPFDYYATELAVGETPISYFFEIRSQDECWFYDSCGLSSDVGASRPFHLVPGFSTPDWAKGAVMYQIFPDRFCNGDPNNDVRDGEYFYLGGYVHHVDDWYQPPGPDSVRDFYGGDLQGILDKLDYLQDLGVQVLYLNPVFVSPSNHKYDTQDYDYIDPHLGVIAEEESSLPDGQDRRKDERYISLVTDRQILEAGNRLFCRLTEELHRRGMKLILDGVFNHCGSFNKWMDREQIYEGLPGYESGAYVSEDSPYHRFFRFRDAEKWPCNSSYVGWWDYDTLPKLNYEGSKELEDYILSVAAKWVSPPYNADGWRLDVAADLGFSEEYNHSFWRKFRDSVKQANPNAIILAEHYGDATAWLKGDQWDTVMNYDAFMDPVTWFFTGMEKHSDAFEDGMCGNTELFMRTMTERMADFLPSSLQTAMNELSNHDHSRFLTRTNQKVGRVGSLGAEAADEGVHPEIMRAAVIMQMTLPGAPTIYYGDEAGLCGFTDPDNRRTYPWGREDQTMLEFHRRAIALRRQYPVLKSGSFSFLCGGQGTLAYGRFDRRWQIAAVFNNTDAESELQIPVWRIRVGDDQAMACVLLTDQSGFSEPGTLMTVREGMLTIALPPFSAAVLAGTAPDKDAS